MGGTKDNRRVLGRKRDDGRSGGNEGGVRHVMAIFEATVRSLSSFALFLLKACCRQSSMFVHE